MNILWGISAQVFPNIDAVTSQGKNGWPSQGILGRNLASLTCLHIWSHCIGPEDKPFCSKLSLRIELLRSSLFHQENCESRAWGIISRKTGRMSFLWTVGMSLFWVLTNAFLWIKLGPWGKDRKSLLAKGQDWVSVFCLQFEQCFVRGHEDNHKDAHVF